MVVIVPLVNSSDDANYAHLAASVSDAIATSMDKIFFYRHVPPKKMRESAPSWVVWVKICNPPIF